MASPHSLGWPARLLSAQRLGTAASPALGCVLLASPHSLGWPVRLLSAQRLGTAASPALGCVLMASPHFLARPPRLRSAACCWLRSALGMAASPALGCLLLALPLTLSMAASPVRSAACVGLASLVWLARTLGLGSKAWHSRLACARLLARGLAPLLARPPCLRSAVCCWPRHTLGAAASPALGCVLLALPHSRDWPAPLVSAGGLPWHCRLACTRLLAVGLASHS